MGTITKGILGGFSGTVGTVIGGSWKGIDYMRSQPSRRTATSSQRQKEQQLKFGLMVKFLQTMNALLMQSFKSYAVKMTGANSALSYNLRNAITGTYPTYTIDYSMALVSRGDLPNALNPTATAAANSVINFAWSDNSGSGSAKATDQVLLVVYCEARNQTVYTIGPATRSANAQSFDVSGFSGEQVQTWVGFFSADGREVATSIFTGQVNVT